MQNIKPFNQLKPDEIEVSKNECAIYLDLYFNFLKEMLKTPAKSYISIFKKIKYKANNIPLNVANETSAYTEYDYMVQIAHFFTITKFFSILVDNNINYIDDLISNAPIPESYYVSGSTKFSKKSIIKLIRNALNHNDKSNFQLFRLLKLKSEPNLALEIFLRKPNLHLKLKVNELIDLLKEILNARSIYDYQFQNKQNQPLISIKELKSALNNNLNLKLIHYYNFDLKKNKSNNKVITNLEGSKKAEFSQTIPISIPQQKATNQTYQYLTQKRKQDCSFALPYILRDNIPFGMTKIYGYSYDINYLINELYNPQSCYLKYIKRINNQPFKNKPEEADTFYYSAINIENTLTRGFSLFASYVIDSIITTSDFKLNNHNIKKNKYRNAFVHGRWYSISSSFTNTYFILQDYQFKDNKTMLTSNNQIIKIKMIDLYNNLKKYLNFKNYDLPISFIKDKSNNGYSITYRIDGLNYYCNMSITTKAPIFLLLKEYNGQVTIATSQDFSVFAKEIAYVNSQIFDSRMFKFIQKMPQIVPQALKTLLNTNSDAEYKKKLNPQITELLNICHEINLNIKPTQTITHYYYQK